MSEPCAKCLLKGRSRVAVVQFRGEHYCTLCESQWIEGQREAHNRVLEYPRRLRAVLKDRGLTLREVAARAGISEVVMGRYVRDVEPSRPGVETFLDVCAAIGTHPNEVLGFIDPRVPKLTAERDRLLEVLAGVRDALAGYDWSKVDPVPQWSATPAKVEEEPYYALESDNHP